MNRLSFLLCMVIASIFGISSKAEDADPSVFRKQRDLMVKTQIEARGISNIQFIEGVNLSNMKEFVGWTMEAEKVFTF